MAEIETPGLLDEVRSIVSDRLQVVSYKWLSRNFMVSSNAAKRLLQDFVEKYGNELEVIYSLSGRLKNNPSTYHIRLVSKDKLPDAKREFDGSCSTQVYSVQPCIPKDPAILWNHEFVQAEILFKQEPVDNCLRDNRFCGVSSSFIKRIAGGTPLGTGNLQVGPTGVSIGSTSYSARQTTAVPKPPQQANDSKKTVKTESRVKQDHEQGGQVAVVDKGKAPKSFGNNKKGPTDKNSTGTGGALASMWGRASAKPKPEAALAQVNDSKQISAAIAEAQISASAEAQICARESVEDGSSDEEGQGFNVKRTSNGEGSRKRRVIFDYSDEEDEYQDAVNLASPDPPKKSTPFLKDSPSAFGLECKLSFEKENKPKIKEEVKESKLSFEKENKPKIKEVKIADDVKVNQDLREKVPRINAVKKTESPNSDKTLSNVPGTDASRKDKIDNVAPKRKKVLKTRIDERGREVTEVVWEGAEPDTKPDNNTVKVAENITTNNAVNRPPVAKKSPALTTAQAGKAGNKKAASKDPKQGNIMSFFKKG